jgi:hypothetical protein
MHCAPDGFPPSGAFFSAGLAELQGTLVASIGEP